MSISQTGESFARGGGIGNLLDTTIALSHLIFEGTLDMFPGLKICSAHGGGYLASYMDRSDHGCLTFPHRVRGRTTPSRCCLDIIIPGNTVFQP